MNEDGLQRSNVLDTSMSFEEVSPSMHESVAVSAETKPVPYATVYEPTPEELNEARILGEQIKREFTYEMLKKISSRQKRDPKYLFSD